MGCRKGHILQLEANFCHSIQYDGAEIPVGGTRPPSLESITSHQSDSVNLFKGLGTIERRPDLLCLVWKFQDRLGGGEKRWPVQTLLSVFLVGQHLSALCCVSEVISQLCFEKQERAAHWGREVLGAFSCQHFQGHKPGWRKAKQHRNPAHLMQLLRPLESTSLALGEGCYIRKCIYLTDTHTPTRSHCKPVFPLNPFPFAAFAQLFFFSTIVYLG